MPDNPLIAGKALCRHSNLPEGAYTVAWQSRVVLGAEFLQPRPFNTGFMGGTQRETARANGGVPYRAFRRAARGAAQCPTERIKFQSLGWAILITSGMATVSMWFALTSAMGFNPVLSFPVAIMWGLIIMGIDRWLVTSMPTRRKAQVPDRRPPAGARDPARQPHLHPDRAADLPVGDQHPDLHHQGEQRGPVPHLTAAQRGAGADEHVAEARSTTSSRSSTPTARSRSTPPATRSSRG